MTVLHQDIGDGRCVRTLVTVVWAWAAGSAVADVLDPGCGAGSFGEDLALQIGHDDLVAIADDEDLSKGMLATDFVAD